MRYTLRQLEYFVAAGEAGSIRHASERLSISQPSISTAISHLELELNVQLFIRHHAQGLSLTAVGQTLLEEARKVISQAESLYSVAAEATDQIRGMLSVGAMVTLAPMIMPSLVHNFLTKHPAAEIRQIASHHEWLVEELRQAEIDTAITYDLQLPPGIEFTPLASLPPHVIVSETHHFAERETVSLGELAAEPMIFLDLPLSRQYFKDLFQKESLQPNIYARVADQAVVRTMVANGYGYSISNVRPCSDLALDGRRVVRIKLSGQHRPMVIGMATLQGMRKSRLLESFLEYCQTLISDTSIPGMNPLE